MAAQYDLNLTQNSTFTAWIQFLQDDNTPVDLTAYTAEFKIERYKDAEYPLVKAFLGEARYGYTGPNSTGIVAAGGGIQLNKNYTGTGLTGGILVELDKTTTDSLPVGKQFYNIKLEFGSSYSEVLLEGRMDVKPE